MVKITHEAGDIDAWICLCGNTPSGDGFDPCDEEGNDAEPVEGWVGLYRCGNCGAIIDYDSLSIIGYNKTKTGGE